MPDRDSTIPGWGAIRRLAISACAATAALLVVGAAVSAAGAGLACPDWPLCHGRAIPPLEPLVLLEYGHRLLASAVGALMLALAVTVWRRARGQRALVRLMTALLLLLAVQVVLGGATVLSRLGPVIVGTHLATAMAFFSLLVLFTARAVWEPGGLEAPRSPGGLRALAHGALAATFLQVTIGGFTSAYGAGLACPDFPLCHGRLIPPVAHPLIVLHYVHRVLGVAVAVLVGVLAARARRAGDPLVRRLGTLAVPLVLAQVLLGALNIWTRLDAGVRVAHLAGAAALLAVLVALVVRLRVAPQGVGAAVQGAGASGVRRAGALAMVADYLSLIKPRIVLLLLITTFTTMLVAAGGWSAPHLVVLTLLGGALAGGAANAINCYWDRDVDALMRRTRRRPLPSGRLAPGRALAFGLGLAAGSVLVLGLGVNWLSAALALAGIVFYVGVYTVWLKRSTPHNIVIGGAAGAVPPLVGWAAVTNGVGLPALLLFGVIFLWTPPHFWALAISRAEDYRAAGIPMLPVVRGEAETVRQIGRYTIGLVAATLALAGLGVLGWVYLAAAVLLAVPLVWLVVRLGRQATPRAASALFAYSIVYLGLLFASMALDRLLA